jgi:hypothetical protein
MRLIKSDIVPICTAAFGGFCDHFSLDPQRLSDAEYVRRRMGNAAFTQYTVDYADCLDFYVTALLARDAQTFLFNSQQILAFIAAIDRKLPPGDYPTPFSRMIIQFTEPIQQGEFLTGIRTGGGPKEEDDFVAGLVIGVDAQGMSVSLWYTSTAINRAITMIGSDGSVLEKWTTLQGISEESIRDKQRILNLAMLCLAYIHSPKIEIEHITADPVVNAKRQRKGKHPLPDYYICQVKRERHISTGPSTPTGRHVSFRFDVQGHFRRLSNGRTIWISSHQRGLDHELYKPKTYRVD